MTPGGPYGPITAPPPSGPVTAPPPSGPVTAPPPSGPVTAPPPGPGVAPPFAAPPIDRSRRSLWIGLAVGGVALVLCCAGGLFGFGLLVVAGNDQVEQQAKRSVEAFVEAVRDRDFKRAHDQLCSDLAERVSPDAVESEFGQHAIITSTIGTIRIGGRAVTVDADLNYADRGPRTYVFTLVSEAGDLKICDWR